MNAHPHDHSGVVGTVYVLHLEPAYRHARHYVGWTAGDVDARVAMHLQGAGSPLLRAAVRAGVDVQLVATYPGSRHLERRLKRWHTPGSSAPPAAHGAAGAPADAPRRTIGAGAFARALHAHCAGPRRPPEGGRIVAHVLARSAPLRGGQGRPPAAVRAARACLIALTFRGSTQPV